MSSLILASASAARQALLSQAGLDFRVMPAQLDESALIAGNVALRAEQLAMMLAEQKALAVAARQPRALVIGADQVLVCDGEIYQKAPNMRLARAGLARLAGRSHQLISAVSVAEGDKVVWRHRETATLTMRTLNDAQIDAYLAATGDAALDWVGGYALEGLGAWLFEKVEGDYFTVLGLPLLPLLGFLAGRGLGPMAGAAGFGAP